MYRKKSSSSNPPFVDGKHNMTCLQLCEGDDLATMMTVDSVLGFTTHKMDKNYNPSIFDKKLREKWKEIMHEFIIDLNYENAYNQLIASDKVKSNLKKDERFKRHIFRFLYLFDKRSGIKISPCFRYENEGRKGAAIFATKEWEKGSQISTLFGCIAEMSPDEEEIFHESKNEFSVMYSTRKNCSQLWLGPAAYVNHDCKPNCRFTEGNDDSKMTLETLRDIHPGDELLIYYGNNFFGIDNAECECFTCELRDQGLFSRHFQGNISRAALSRPENHLTPTRHIATRSTKTHLTNGGITVMDRTRLSLPAASNGGVDRLKESNETYSLRVTYSRIDRVKKRISACGTPNILSSRLNGSQKAPSSVTKLSSRQVQKPVVTNRQLLRSVPVRRSVRQAATVVPVKDPGWGKLTIKLRRDRRVPGQYEQMSGAPAVSGRPVLSTCNIFTRITEMYLTGQGGHRSPSSSSPSSSVIVIGDSPPSLSPWFSDSTKTAMSVTRSTAAQYKRQGAPVPPTRAKIPRHASPATHTLRDTHRHTTTTADSDLPSYSASSPTIPVLEIESETDLGQPTPPTPSGSSQSRLVCELREPPVPNSPNKGIVMKFSRISGDKFISLLS